MLITGATSGLGKAACQAVAGAGAEVVLVSRRKEELEAVAESLPGRGHLAAPIDLAANADLNDWMSNLGPLDGLAHFAGIQLTAPLRALSPQKAEAMFAINVTAALALAKAFRARGTARKPASMVLVSSAMGLVGAPGRAAYSASKAAVIGMTKSMAVELAPEGINVNCLAPGFVKTEMWEETKKLLSEAQQQSIIDSHPLGLGEPEDIGNAAVFLLSPAARWITGTTLVIDGGYTAQ